MSVLDVDDDYTFFTTLSETELEVARGTAYILAIEGHISGDLVNMIENIQLENLKRRIVAEGRQNDEDCRGLFVPTRENIS